MLPQELSSDICGLRPGEAAGAFLHHDDRSGQRIRSYSDPGVIRSVRRMTYTQVHAVISGDQQTREEFGPLVAEFERMYELARLLHKKRQRRGSIDFDLPEPVIEFDSRAPCRASFVPSVVGPTA